MNSDGKRLFDETNSYDQRAKMQKVYARMENSIFQLEKCLEFSNEFLSECRNKLIDLHSEMTDLKNIMDDVPCNEQQSLDGSELMKKKSLEETRFDSIKQRLHISRENDDERKRLKLTANSKNDEISTLDVQICDKYTAGPSRIATRVAKNNTGKVNQSRNVEETCEKEENTDQIEVIEPSETVPVAEILESALKKTKGELSSDEFSTFLYLSDRVHDPVQLAKVSFTKDIKMLYFQLMTFHFHLKNDNDNIEREKGASCTNRELEDKIKFLIHTFQREIQV